MPSTDAVGPDFSVFPYCVDSPGSHQQVSFTDNVYQLFLLFIDQANLVDLPAKGETPCPKQYRLAYTSCNQKAFEETARLPASNHPGERRDVGLVFKTRASFETRYLFWSTCNAILGMKSSMHYIAETNVLNASSSINCLDADKSLHDRER